MLSASLSGGKTSTSTATAVHRCFLMPEMVGLVCEAIHLDSANLEHQRRRDLAAMARTCRAFLEPANHNLWSKMDSLLPFIKCMPNDLWKEEIEESGEARYFKLVFLRPVAPTDVEALTVHSSRLKHLTVRWRDHHYWFDDSVRYSSPTRTPAEIYEALHAAALTAPVFPNLVSLFLPDLSPGLPILCDLIGPHLAELGIDFLEGNDYSLVESLPQRFPGLRSLKIMNPPSHSLSSAICHLPHLRCLHTHCVLSPEAFTHLMDLPYLLKLSLHSFEAIPQRASDAPTLHALRDLRVEATLAEKAIELLSCVTSCQLRGISLAFNDGLTPPDTWSRLCYTIGTHISHSSLQSVRLENHRRETVGVDQSEMLEFDMIRPLLSLSNIRNLTLVIPVGLDLDDAGFEELARAFPRLENLDFSHAIPFYLRPRATLGGLSAFAQYCPNISDLTVSIDASNVNNFPPSARPSDSPVCLAFERSPIQDAQWVASKLSEMFSNIRSLHGFDDTGSHSDPWDVVERLLSLK